MAWVLDYSTIDSKDAYFEYDKKTKILTMRFYGSSRKFTTDMTSLNNTTYSVKFKDTIWTNLEDHIVITTFGSEKNDRIVGNGIWRDYIEAGDGNDVITGSGTLIGGKGNDIINANVKGSADTVFFEKGDGHDVINAVDISAAPVTDTLYLKDISVDDTSWVRKGNNLVFTFNYDDGTAADSITLSNFFAGEKYQTFHYIAFEKDGFYLADIRKNFIFNQQAEEKGSKLIGTPWRNKIYGNKGNDIIISTGVENYIDAGAGNDRINAVGTIIGGAGNDTITLNVAGRSSVIHFGLNDGKDVINSYDKLIAEDTLRFGSGITKDDLSYERKGNNLIIYVKGRDSGDQITVNNYFRGEQYQTIHKFEFTNASGQVIQTINDIRDPAQHTFKIVGSDKNDAIVGTPWGNYIAAGAGNDKITGAGTIVGGAGNDNINLNVAGSKDTVVFNVNDGKDVINSYDKLMAEDTLRFGSGITKDDLSYERKGNNLIIYVKGRDSGDQITVNNYFRGEQYQTIHKFEFTNASGQVVQTINDIRDPAQHTFNIVGSDRNDAIIGTPWANYIAAGAGNDKITGAGTIVGGQGNDVITLNVKDSQDTIIFNVTDGKDVINANKSIGITDTLRFGSGISNNDLSYERKGNNLIIYVKGRDSGDQITINNYFKGAQYQTIHKFEFTDSNGQVISGQTINDIVNSGYVFTMQGIDGKNNTILGSQLVGKDNLIGGDRNDKITGSGTITGGKGNDVINITTNGSSDVIHFQLGDGKDVINSLDKAPVGQKGNDTIIFGDQITKDMVKLVKKGNNLIIQIGDNDQITVNNYFRGADYQTIKTIKFAQSGETITINPNVITTTPSGLMASIGNQADSLLNAMASFAIDSSAESLVNDRPLDINTILLAPSS